MTRPDAIARMGARVLLVDAADRVLLLHGIDPARPEHSYWFTAGGGLDPGETAQQGAARELHEETGLVVSVGDLGEPVWHEVIEFPWDGQWYRQDQQYFLVRVHAWDVVPAGFTDVEQRFIDEYRWWSAGELRASGARYYPPDLPDLLDRVLTGAAPC